MSSIEENQTHGIEVKFFSNLKTENLVKSLAKK